MVFQDAKVTVDASMGGVRASKEVVVTGMTASGTVFITSVDSGSGNDTRGAMEFYAVAGVDKITIYSKEKELFSDVEVNYLAIDETGINSAVITTGVKSVTAIGTFPYNILTNTEAAAAFCKLENYDATTTLFSDISLSSSLAGVTADYQLSPDTAIENDAVYFGAAAPFGAIYIDISGTVQTYAADSLTWEYYNGTAWVALTILYDATDSTAQDGLRSFAVDGYIVFSAPSAWASTTVDSQAAYWIRARCSSTVNITQAGLTDSHEHYLVTATGGTQINSTGTISRGRFNWGTLSATNSDTKIVLYNFTSGVFSAEKTLTKGVAEHVVADFDLAVTSGDIIGFFVTLEDGTTEFADGICELTITK